MQQVIEKLDSFLSIFEDGIKYLTGLDFEQ